MTLLCIQEAGVFGWMKYLCMGSDALMFANPNDFGAPLTLPLMVP